MEESSDVDYHSRAENKDALMARIDREWTALEQAIAGLPDKRMLVPDAGGWSIKDNLAHLSAWEEFLRLHYLGKMPAAEAFGMEEAILRDVTQINDAIFTRNEDRPLQDVLAGMRATHAQLITALARMSFQEMLQPLAVEEDPEQHALLDEIVNNTYDHYREHRATIEKLVKGGTA